MVEVGLLLIEAMEGLESIGQSFGFIDTTENAVQTFDYNIKDWAKPGERISIRSEPP